MVARLDPGLLRGRVFPVDVDVRRRIVADEHRGEAHRAELGDVAGDLGADPRGKIGPSHQRRRHGRGLSAEISRGSAQPAGLRRELRIRAAIRARRESV